MVRKKGKDRDRERLKIDMQFQVHTADDDKILRCGKSYGGEYTSGASMPEKRRIIFKVKKIAETIMSAQCSWHQQNINKNMSICQRLLSTLL